MEPIEPEFDPFEDEHEDTTCERCKCCDTYWEDCYDCGGEGFHDGWEEDPLWYNMGDIVKCSTCNGTGGWKLCHGKCDENGNHKD